jgi:allantoicase
LIIPGKHACILRLGHAGTISTIEVDTNFFKGNFPESVLIEGISSSASDDAFTDPLKEMGWKVVVPRSRLTAHFQHVFQVENKDPLTHLRVTIFPDGGVSRVRVNGYIV